MQMQSTTPRNNSTSSSHEALGFSYAILFCGALQEATALLGHLLFSLTGAILHTLPCLLLVVWRLLGAPALDLECFWRCYRLLASLAPLAHCLLAMALR